MAIWKSAANPGAATLETTVAGKFPRVTLTPLAVVYISVDGTRAPTGAEGMVGPNPVPQRIMISPGAAGAVFWGNVPFFTASL
jgi:hypothetical protein